MSAKHGAKESAAWTRELDVILLDGIEDNRQGKDLAHERVKALHPLPQGKDGNARNSVESRDSRVTHSTTPFSV
jgi:hypothetical protein